MDTDGGSRRTLVGNLLDNIEGITIDQKDLYRTIMEAAAGHS
jgi:hypothetical protein